MRLSCQLAVCLLLSVALAATGCGGSGGSAGERSRPSKNKPERALTPADVPRDAPTLLAAGDIGDCDSRGDEQTARLARKLPRAHVAALGDLAYPRGTATDYARCWEPSWGRLGNRVRPAPGNHEYGAGEADTYFKYFGPRAGPAGKGWYSYEIGAWHVVVLNSNCSAVPGGGCEKGSDQERWLRADLEASGKRCTLAYWHHPRHSSGFHGDDPSVEPLRQALADAHGEILLSGHDHHYERFAARNGIRDWVVGTGGAHNYPVGVTDGSKVRWSGGHGLLALTLRPDRYEWRFLTAGGSTFSDSGSGRCR